MPVSKIFSWSKGFVKPYATESICRNSAILFGRKKEIGIFNHKIIPIKKIKRFGQKIPFSFGGSGAIDQNKKKIIIIYSDILILYLIQKIIIKKNKENN